MSKPPIQTIVSTAAALEPLRLQECKDQLRIYTDELDTQIYTALAEMRELCEASINRTLRTEVSRKISYDKWPSSPIPLPWPPLISVTSITYYDGDNTEQTVAEANYRVHVSQELQGQIEFVSTWSAPTTYNRMDAVNITYKAGYQTREATPECVKRAIKILLSIEFDDVPPQREENARKRAFDCLAAVAWGPYR